MNRKEYVLEMNLSELKKKFNEIAIATRKDITYKSILRVLQERLYKLSFIIYFIELYNILLIMLKREIYNNRRLTHFFFFFFL